MRKRTATVREQADLIIGERVDEAVSKLREVGIVIEGSQAHLAHAILRSEMTKATGLVRRVESSVPTTSERDIT